MKKQLPVNRNNEQGFTLLELLVVLVIIGLLAGIVGPRLFKNVSKSEVTTAKAQIDSLGKAIDQYRLDVGRYPSTQEGLGVLVTTNSDPNWHGPYLKKAVPQDPWNMPYQYKNPGEHNREDYDLYSFGADKTLGGDKENADLGNW
ncbi:type II secretion system major pseudopilin GspG [Aquirhabdus sp.]|uniref:type II secretion system major pseudopilin GspG n=1 Tax=Aquirhabdus sp. TaxID=2824160 RepID=UPI00396C533F